MNIFIHFLIILLNIYSIVFLFLIVQRVIPNQKTTVHLLFTLIIVFICFTYSTDNKSESPVLISSLKSASQSFSIDPLCQVELSITSMPQPSDSSLHIVSRLKGLVAGLRWEQSSTVNHTTGAAVHYQVLGKIKYLILGFPVLSRDQVFSGMIKFDELRNQQEPSSKWNTPSNNTFQNNLMQKMY